MLKRKVKDTCRYVDMVLGHIWILWSDKFIKSESYKKWMDEVTEERNVIIKNEHDHFGQKENPEE